MSLAGAAQALGIPETLVQRSAAARAQETGMSVDEILAAWAGGEVVESAPAEPDEPEAAATEETAQEETAPAEPTIETAPPVTVEEDRVLEPVAAAASRVTPAEVTAAEAALLPEVVTVPTAGIRERTDFTLPRWLFGLMLIIPAFALFTLGGSATGVCGDATELEMDVVTGEIVNCDGSEFTGSGIGGGSTDFIALGEAVYNGSAVGGVNCSGCHGANGGGGVGPALNGVLTTFGACADHDEWVRIGSPGFQAAGETTYGDTNKPIAGGMPAHATLSEEQLASVSAFERVRFGGGSPDEVLADCGLTEDEEAGNGSGTTVPGEEGSGTTVPGEDGSGTTVG